MRSKLLAIAFVLIGSSCSPQERTENSDNLAVAGNEVSSSRPEAAGDQPTLPEASAGDRQSLPEGPIDPKSAQGAGQVVQQFAALLEQGRFDEANALAEDDLAAQFRSNAETHAEIGAPGPVEGAAGSLYVEIPVRFYGKQKDGGSFSTRATATLRRSNDVPGSTELQRRWRIYRLEMQPPS